MANQKLAISKNLSVAHLRAIGAVAATWSNLESTLLFMIADFAEVDAYKTISLIGPNGFGAWLDILYRIADSSTKHRFRVDTFNVIAKRLNDAHAKRNTVVHADWYGEKRGILSEQTRLTGSHQAKAMAIRKRGKETAKSLKYTADEIVAIAKEIEDAQLALVLWGRQKPSAQSQLPALLSLAGVSNPGQKK